MVADIMQTVKSAVFKSRSRTLEHFRPFDNLRSGSMKKLDFVRTLAKLKLDHLSVADMEKLAEHYETPSDPTKTDYATFCADADQVFGPVGLEKDPLKVVARPGEGINTEFIPKNFEDADQEQACRRLLFRVALLCKTRGIVFKYCYKDFDSLHRGVVTPNQFTRALPTTLTAQEQDLLIARYSDKGADGGLMVNYRAMHEDISEVTAQVKAQENAAAEAQGEGVTEAGNQVETKWTCDSLTVENVIAAKVNERHIRINEFFKDFDPLKKGKCTVEKVRCVLTNCKLELTQAQFDELVSKYTLEDGMFNFKKMCEVVEDPATFVNAGKGPLRNSIVLSDEEKAYNLETLNIIKSAVVKNRLDLTNVLRDFDTTCRGHIPKTQFARALQTSGVEMLSLGYTNTGASDLVDYRQFIKDMNSLQFVGRSGEVH